MLAYKAYEQKYQCNMPASKVRVMTMHIQLLEYAILSSSVLVRPRNQKADPLLS